MTQSAKRYGVEVAGDLELENRLRRIEVALAASGGGNQDATSLSRGAGSVPQVTGLRLGGTIPGGFTINWNAVTISDLRRYEVQFATDLAFAAGTQAFSAVTTTWAFTTASTDVYFARVRAVNNNGTAGSWSITLNTTTGQAATGDIEDGAVTGPKLDDNDIGDKLALRGYIDNRTANNSTDTDHDIDIEAGLCRDATNVASIVIPALTKQIDNSWTLGTNQGGLASALTLSADTAYHMFVVSDGETVDAGFDTDPQAANLLSDLPEGMTLYRRIGAVVTDSTANIMPYKQYGNFFQLDEPIQDVFLSNPVGTTTHTLIHVPIGIEVACHMSINWRPDATTTFNSLMYYGPVDATFAPAGSDGGTIGAARVLSHSAVVMLNTSGQMKTGQSGNNSDVKFSIRIHGWEDQRGANGTT